MQGDYEVSKVQAVVILRLPASKVLDINTGWGSDTKPRTQHQGPVQGLCDEAVCDTAHRLNVGGTSFRTTEITLRQNMESITSVNDVCRVWIVARNPVQT